MQSFTSVPAVVYVGEVRGPRSLALQGVLYSCACSYWKATLPSTQQGRSSNLPNRQQQLANRVRERVERIQKMEAGFICLAASVLFLLASATACLHYITSCRIWTPSSTTTSAKFYSRVSLHNASLRLGTDLSK